MPQIFPRSANAWSRTSVVAAGALAVGTILLLMALIRSPLQTDQGVVLDQPVPFSHDHHTEVLGIHCGYCHTSVETSSFAGIPPTETCMNCHSQIWTGSEMLEPVRESWRTQEPIAWNRVYDLPDFVYFDHSIHVAKGIGCSSCHGAVNEMPLIRQYPTLEMQWCLDCHREPEKHVRPKSEIYNMKWEPPSNQRELGLQLVAEYNIQGRDSCSACHR